nr:PREDICTED: uncharacterized protein LOC102365224 isoform X2 [Latimeria chalumnae]|eukprot:XP_014341746.1 PREDICTED: uncharacterized protein LOC102365224 isoform X2 [Latimeria chalumnae]
MARLGTCARFVFCGALALTANGRPVFSRPCSGPMSPRARAAVEPAALAARAAGCRGELLLLKEKPTDDNFRFKSEYPNGYGNVSSAVSTLKVPFRDERSIFVCCPVVHFNSVFTCQTPSWPKRLLH